MVPKLRYAPACFGSALMGLSISGDGFVQISLLVMIDSLIVGGGCFTGRDASRYLSYLGLILDAT